MSDLYLGISRRARPLPHSSLVVIPTPPAMSLIPVAPFRFLNYETRKGFVTSLVKIAGLYFLEILCGSSPATVATATRTGKLLNEKLSQSSAGIYFLEFLGGNSRTNDHETSPKAFGVVVMDKKTGTCCSFPG
jgi:hypothetical protein